VFTRPPGPVRLAVDGRDTGVLLGRDDGRPPPVLGGRLLDVTRYAPPGPPPWGPQPRLAGVTLVLDRTLGFVDGLPAVTYPINGAVYPAVPDIVVRRGDLVRMTIVNRGSEPHPMHPHGHAVLVLARDGRPASGPLWMAGSRRSGPRRRGSSNKPRPVQPPRGPKRSEAPRKRSSRSRRRTR